MGVALRRAAAVDLPRRIDAVRHASRVVRPGSQTTQRTPMGRRQARASGFHPSSPCCKPKRVDVEPKLLEPSNALEQTSMASNKIQHGHYHSTSWDCDCTCNFKHNYSSNQEVRHGISNCDYNRTCSFKQRYSINQDVFMKSATVTASEYSCQAIRRFS